MASSSETAVALAAAVLLCASWLLGGGSEQGTTFVAVIELVALVPLCLGVVALVRQRAWREHRIILVLWASLLCVPLIQLVPLPVDWWAHLPGRAPMAEALRRAGLSPDYLSFSLSPDATWAAFLGLLPPTAMLLCGLVLTPKHRIILLFVMIALTALAVVWGAAQVATSSSMLRVVEPLSLELMTGPFRNRNHLASLILITLPFVAVVLTFPSTRNEKHSSLAWGALLVLLIVALGAIRSRAGVVVAIPTLLGCLALWIDRRPRQRTQYLIGSLVAMGSAVGLIALFGLTPILDRFDTDLEAGRLERWPYVIRAAQAFGSWGTGLGSFDPVFRAFEPLKLLSPVYFNQAHNEYLQIWLEAGLLGLVILGCALVWLVAETWRVWSNPSTALGRAASVALGAIVLHSAVDYPLRHEAVLVPFALLIAILAADGRARSDIVTAQ